jgi:hypothetical protein
MNPNSKRIRRLGFVNPGVFWLLLIVGAATLLLSGTTRRTSQASPQGAQVKRQVEHPPARHLKPIETVHSGDRDWAYDPASRDWSVREVVRPLVHQYQGDFVTIGIAGSRIEATGNHPFWVTSGEQLEDRPQVRDVPVEQREAARRLSGRWVEARSLRVGDLCVLGSGSNLLGR